MSIALRVFHLIQGYQALEVELRQQLAEALASDQADADGAVEAEAAAESAEARMWSSGAALERLTAAPNDAMAQLEALEGFLSSLGSAEA